MATNVYVMDSYAGVTNTASTVYTVPGSASESLIIGLMLTNTSTTDINVSVTVRDASKPTGQQNVKICNAMFLPKNSTFNVLNDNSRMVLSTSDQIIVNTASAGQTVDVVVSAMEIRG